MSRSNPAKVLLVDDQVENLIALEAVLEPLGQELVRAKSGKEALTWLLRDEFALILMDVQMPELDGFAATERLREQGYTGLIVALTAHARPEELQQCRLSGCDACLSKPIDGSLLGLISQLTQRAEAERSPAV